MHREMGMNVIRLWGGNGGAAKGLWDAADELGVMLFQGNVRGEIGDVICRDGTSLL